MYLLDPGQGRGRRARLRDKVASRAHGATRAARAAARDLRNRARGTAAQVQHWSSMQEGQVPDRVLIERVRSRIGRCVSHPRALKVESRDGRVTLHGKILSSEHDNMLRAVRRVRGIQDVEDLVQRYDSAEGVSSLQGEGSLRGRGRQAGSAPAARVVSAGTGAALLVMGLRRRGVTGALASLAGVLMLTHAMTTQRPNPLSAPRATPARGTGRGSRSESGSAPQRSREEIGAPGGWQPPAAPRSGETSPADERDGEGAQVHPKPSI
jgi:hypothetical protein